MKTRISLINFPYSTEECNVCILVSWQVKYSDNHNYFFKKMNKVIIPCSRT